MYDIGGHPSGCFWHISSSGLRCWSKGCLRPTYRDSIVVSSSRVAIDILTLEDETPIMSRNVGHQSYSNPALHRRRMKTSAMVQKRKDYTLQFTFVCHNNMVGEQRREQQQWNVTLRSTVIANTYHLEKPSEKVCAFFQGNAFVTWKILRWWLWKEFSFVFGVLTITYGPCSLAYKIRCCVGPLMYPQVSYESFWLCSVPAPVLAWCERLYRRVSWRMLLTFLSHDATYRW